MPSTAWSIGASSKTMLAALPPSSRVTFLSVPATVLAIARPTSVEPVKATLSTSGWRDQRRPGGAGAGDDVDHARRQVGLLADLGEQQRRQRRGLGRLEDDGVAGRERGRDLPGQHQEREVPRDDLARRRRAARVGRSRRTRACRPSRRSRRSAPPPSGTSTSRDSLIGLPLSSDSSTASSRARSWMIRAMRKRYLARSAPGIRRPHPAVGPAGGRRRRGRRRPRRPRRPRRGPPRWPGEIVLKDAPLAVDELAVDEQAVGRPGGRRLRGDSGAGA